MRYVSFILVLLFQLSKFLIGQSCCSASTPVTGNLQISNIESGKFLFITDLLYEEFSTVYDVNKKIDEHSRERHSFLIQTGIHYGISDKYTLTFSIPWVYQRRTNAVFDGSENTLNVSGIGDIALSIKYALKKQNLLSSSEMDLGIGIKLPTGRNNLKIDNIRIAPELQPGTGSVDGVLWFLYSRGYVPGSKLNYQIVTSYTLTGRNSINYEFGDEWLFLFALKMLDYHAIIIHGQAFLRFLQKEQRDNTPVENTGGWRFFISPQISLHISPKIALSAEYQFPVYHHLNGIQLSSTRRITLSAIYTR